MPKSLRRALRRHHYRRLKRKRERFWYGASSAPMGPRRLGMAVATPKVCSCWMCGNPRRYSREKTLQERKADLALRGQEYESDVANAQPEYDFSRGVRGKYAKRYHQGSNVVVLDPDVAERFPNSEAVNQALRSLADMQDRKKG